VATGYIGGSLDLEHLRGRSCRPTDVQAAEHHLRTHLSMTGVDDLVVADVSRTGTGTAVTFRTPLGSHRVGVRRVLGPEERLTCHGDATQRPPRFELLAIETV
jgi:hypothetical protein